MMKKSLVALAVLAVSGVASAQSTVTIYGILDAWIGTVKDNNLSQSGVNVPHPFSGSGGGLQTSRFGLKGSEDLGSGLKANFLLEAGFDPSTGAANNYTNPYTNADPERQLGADVQLRPVRQPNLRRTKYNDDHRLQYDYLQPDGKHVQQQILNGAGIFL